MADVAVLVRRNVRGCATCPAGIISTGPYGVDAPFMLLQQHGWNIHAI